MPDADRQEVELVALPNAWTNAINGKDRSQLEALMAPDYALHAWGEVWHVKRAESFKNLLEGYDIADQPQLQASGSSG